MKRYITSESVRKGHPDKLSDLISDSILDACLKEDPMSRVAVETMATAGNIIIAGELTTKAYVDIEDITRNTLRDAGYSPDRYTLHILVHPQSEDIKRGVDNSTETRLTAEKDTGAGDQGTMYGYATDETEELMPLPLVLSSFIVRTIDELWKIGKIQGIGPDGKAQVTVEYEDDRPERISSVVVSVQHDEEKSHESLKADIMDILMNLPSGISIDDDTEILINPSGRFVLGGPEADTGLTGRKIIADTYGGIAPHGGGAFSGKDPTKVDRSAAYMARAIARNIVEAGIASRCLVSLSYAIGKAEPTAVNIDTYGTGMAPDDEIRAAVIRAFDLRPSAIIRELGLREPIYEETASYGHFLRDFPWERLDRMAELMEALG